MLPAEDHIMTSSVDEAVHDDDEHIPLWLGKTTSHARTPTWFSIRRRFHFPHKQSRTGGVLGAVPSPAVMGASRIFFPGGADSGVQKS